MIDNDWSPEYIVGRKQQNFCLSKDVEEAYEFVEKFAFIPISGDLEGFLHELIRKRWNLACNNVYEPAQVEINQFTSKELGAVFSNSPYQLRQMENEQQSQSGGFLQGFRAYLNQWKYEEEAKYWEPNKLYGYGTDGYGTYLPLHLLWPNHKNYWGIYISEEGLMSLTASFYEKIKGLQLKIIPEENDLQLGHLIEIAYQVILRHQLFHFKVEQWALHLELATSKPFYFPYLQNVYLPSIYEPEDTNLEEALANISILLSKKILKLEYEAGFFIRSIIEEFCKRQGPGYRNLDLSKGVPFSYRPQYLQYREAVNYLCNQILKHELRPTQPLVPYYLYPPNNNFLRAENLCPVYLVRNLSYQMGVIT